MDNQIKQQILDSINEVPVVGEGGLIDFIIKGEILFAEMKEAGLSHQKITEIDSSFKS